MRFSELRPEIQARLAVAVPLVALFLSLFVVYPAWGRYTQMNAQIAQQRKDLAVLKAAPLPPPLPQNLTARILPSEPPQFLGQVSAVARLANCRMAGFDLTPTAPPGPQDKGSDLVHAVRARIELEATYPQIREFLAQLGNAPRLFVVTGLDVLTPDIKAAQGQAAYSGVLHASIEIERYVTTSAADAPTS